MPLHSHQQRIVDKLISCRNHGIIAYHAMGSGKTLSALMCLKKLDGHKLVITPASLIDNFHREALKHNFSIDSNTFFYSYEKGMRDRELIDRHFTLVVFDEAHRLRNINAETYQYYQQISANSDKVLLMSGTAEYNQPSDIGALINFINPAEKFPDTLNKFCRKYIDSDTQTLKNTKQLAKILRKYIDYHPGESDSEFYPAKRFKLCKIAMSVKQEIVYKYLEKKLPFTLKRLVEKNLPASLQESALVNMYASAIRQASDSIVKFDKTATPWDSPKLVAAVQSMVNAAKCQYFRGLVYSNYIDAGLEPYAAMLNHYGIEPLMFTGALTHKKKMNIVETYNRYSPAPIVLLISSSGGEGVNLKGTRLVQILEPHFNRAKIDQVIARAVRYESHAHLEPKDRLVEIEEYFSLLNKNFFNKFFHIRTKSSIDEFLYAASIRKKKIIDELLSLL